MSTSTLILKAKLLSGRVRVAYCKALTTERYKVGLNIFVESTIESQVVFEKTQHVVVLQTPPRSEKGG